VRFTKGLEGNGRSKAEVKNHPVNGFSVPRAGPATVPVAGDEPLRVYQTKQPLIGGCFFVHFTKGLEGNGRSKAEVKNHPVNGFSVPRAGPATAPVATGKPRNE